MRLSQVFALGVTSVFEQILEALDDSTRTQVWAEIHLKITCC